VACLFVCLPTGKAHHRVEALTYDARVRWTAKPNADPSIIIIDIDDASFETMKAAQLALALDSRGVDRNREHVSKGQAAGHCFRRHLRGSESEKLIPISPPRCKVPATSCWAMPSPKLEWTLPMHTGSGALKLLDPRVPSMFPESPKASIQKTGCWISRLRTWFMPPPAWAVSPPEHSTIATARFGAWPFSLPAATVPFARSRCELRNLTVGRQQQHGRSTAKRRIYFLRQGQRRFRSMTMGNLIWCDTAILVPLIPETWRISLTSVFHLAGLLLNAAVNWPAGSEALSRSIFQNKIVLIGASAAAAYDASSHAVSIRRARGARPRNCHRQSHPR